MRIGLEGSVEKVLDKNWAMSNVYNQAIIDAEEYHL